MDQVDHVDWKVCSVFVVEGPFVFFPVVVHVGRMSWSSVNSNVVEHYGSHGSRYDAHALSRLTRAHAPALQFFFRKHIIRIFLPFFFCFLVACVRTFQEASRNAVVAAELFLATRVLFISFTNAYCLLKCSFPVRWERNATFLLCLHRFRRDFVCRTFPMEFVARVVTVGAELFATFTENFGHGLELAYFLFGLTSAPR